MTETPQQQDDTGNNGGESHEGATTKLKMMGRRFAGICRKLHPSRNMRRRVVYQDTPRRKQPQQQRRKKQQQQQQKNAQSHESAAIAKKQQFVAVQPPARKRLRKTGSRIIEISDEEGGEEAEACDTDSFVASDGEGAAEEEDDNDDRELDDGLDDDGEDEEEEEDGKYCDDEAEEGEEDEDEDGDNNNENDPSVRGGGEPHHDSLISGDGIDNGEEDGDDESTTSTTDHEHEHDSDPSEVASPSSSSSASRDSFPVEPIALDGPTRTIRYNIAAQPTTSIADATASSTTTTSSSTTSTSGGGGVASIQSIVVPCDWDANAGWKFAVGDAVECIDPDVNDNETRTVGIFIDGCRNDQQHCRQIRINCMAPTYQVKNVPGNVPRRICNTRTAMLTRRIITLRKPQQIKTMRPVTMNRDQAPGENETARYHLLTDHYATATIRRERAPVDESTTTPSSRRVAVITVEYRYGDATAVPLAIRITRPPPPPPPSASTSSAPATPVQLPTTAEGNESDPRPTWGVIPQDQSAVVVPSLADVEASTQSRSSTSQQPTTEASSSSSGVHTQPIDAVAPLPQQRRGVEVVSPRRYKVDITQDLAEWCLRKDVEPPRLSITDIYTPYRVRTMGDIMTSLYHCMYETANLTQLVLDTDRESAWRVLEKMAHRGLVSSSTPTNTESHDPST